MIKPHTISEIYQMQYDFQYCVLCNKKMDCCLDTVVVSTYGVHCTTCWGKRMSSFYDGKVDEFVRKRKKKVLL